MEADRKPFAQAAAKRDEDRQREMLPMVRMLAGAAPVMQSLMTESDAWNRYLSIVQGFLLGIRKQKDNALAKLADASVWEPHQVMKLKSDVLQANAMIEALECVISLPKALMDGGEAAQEIVRKFEEKYEAAGQPQP